ncbi:MAG TPA: hypothetical protein VEH10_05500 [Thermoplasmata archaeon]|nr:hypothetical protein [Thermoplasmata archaeon]
MSPDPPARPHDAAEAVEPCLVPGCGAPSIRHLSRVEAAKAFDGLPEKGRRAPLCRDHYREWKKATRERRALDRLGR